MTHVMMDTETWMSMYKPIENHLDDNASWQDGEGRGFMFETYGEELDFVLAAANEDNSRVWTYMDGDDGGTIIVDGYWVVNRIGYFITEQPFEGDSITVEVSPAEPEEDEEQ